jgi:small subunit ribosomal protein S4
MARYIGPVCKLCRREGMKLYLNADRCYSEKCSVTRRPKPPGQHGDKRIKLSEYGIRLREKQKVRRIYGILERQYRRYFDKADHGKGVTGDVLLQLLERRLDNVVFRMGFARTRSEARQLVLHRHFLVNGKRVNVPSFLVHQGDVITVAEKSQSKAVFESSQEVASRRETPAWVEREGLTGTVKMLPEREAVTLPIEEQLIVEFYSR